MVLPFPFDAVESFFNNIFNDITRTILELPSKIFNFISSGITTLSNLISSSVTNIIDRMVGLLGFFKDQIVGALVGLPSAILGLVGGVKSVIEPFFIDIFNRLSGFFDFVAKSLQANITSFILSAQNTIINAVTSLPSSINAFISNISNTLFTVSDRIFSEVVKLPSTLFPLFTNLKDLFLSGINDVRNSIQANLSFIANIGATLQNQIGTLGFNIQQLFTPITSLLGQLPQIGQQLSQGILQQLGASITALKALVFDPLFNIMQDVFSQARVAFRPTGSITPEAASTQVQQQGPLILAAQLGVLSFGALGEFFSWGQVDQVARAANDAIRQTGIDVIMKDWIVGEYEIGVRPALVRAILKKFTPLIPNPSDLVQMVVREAFVPEFRTPAPALFKQFMLEVGFDEFWSDTFWTAHWRPIEFETAANMFHRGIIDRDDLIRRLVILDFRPDDANLLQQLIFRLPNRIEARLMSRFGLLTDDQINEILRAEGVREDFIDPLRTMMQEFSLTSIFSRTETTGIAAFEDGLLGESELRGLLTKIKRPEGIIDQDLALARLKRDLEYRRFAISTVINTMKKGQIDKEQGRIELINLGLDTDRIALILARIQFELDLRTSKAVKVNAPDLTVSQLQQALKRGKITLDDTINALSAKGYDANEVRVLIETAQPPPIDKIITIGQILSAFKKEVIDEAEAKRRLKAQGLEDDEVNILIASNLPPMRE